MSNPQQTSSAPTRKAAGGVFARHGWAMLAAATATIVVETGVFVLTRPHGRLACALGTLTAMLVWVALAAPVLAASARDALGALLRGGIVADASAVCLLVLWLFGPRTDPGVTFLAAVKIYCVLAAVALAGIAAVRCARSPTGRYVAATVIALVVFAAMTTPFWTGGILEAAGGKTQEAIITCAVYANPMYSILSATAHQLHYIWHGEGLMYDISLLAESGSAPPAVPWYAAVVIWGALAGILATMHLVRPRKA